MSRKSQYGGGIEDRVKRPAAIRAENISKFSAAEAKRKSDLRKQRTAINKQVNAEMPDLMSAFSNMSTREQVPMDQVATMDQETMDQEAMDQAAMEQAADQDANSLADQMQGMELEKGGKKSKRRHTKRRHTKRRHTKRRHTKRRR